MVVSFVRKLKFYERFCATLSVVSHTEIRREAGGISHDAIITAFDCLRHKHPYFRMIIRDAAEFNTGNEVEGVVQEGFSTVSSSLGYYEDVDQPINHVKLDYEGFNWEKQMVSVVNAPRERTGEGVSRTLAAISADGTHAHIYFEINHCSIDGPGLFRASGDLIEQLEMVIATEKESLIMPDSRPFIDSIGVALEKVTARDKEEPKTLPVMHGTLPAPASQEELASGQVACLGVFSRMSAVETEGLRTACRNHGTTVQGALQLAVTCAHARIYADSDPLPQMIGHQVPANMRSLLGFSTHDVVNSSAGLWWMDELRADDRVWTVAERYKAAIHENKHQLSNRFIWRAENGGAPFPITIMSSSIGVNSMRPRYGATVVEHVHMQGGVYGEKSKEFAGTMTHAHTFRGCLETTISYFWPQSSRAWADRFSSLIMRVLTLLAREEIRPDMTVAHLLDRIETTDVE